MSFRPKIKKDSSGMLEDLPLDAETLQGSTKSQIINSARDGLATQTALNNKLGKTETATNSSKLEGLSKQQIINEARSWFDRGQIHIGDGTTGVTVTDDFRTVTVDCSTYDIIGEDTSISDQGYGELVISAGYSITLSAPEVKDSNGVPLVNENDIRNKMDRNEISSWAKAPNKPTYTWNEIQNKPELPLDPIQLVLKYVYPVGSIYMSMAPVSPGTFLGGTWQLLSEGLFLCSTQSNSEVTGGSTSHTHQYGMRWYDYYGDSTLGIGTDAGALEIDKWGHVSIHKANKTGNKNMAFNNGLSSGIFNKAANEYTAIANTSPSDSLPPYITTYMWKRTA